MKLKVEYIPIEDIKPYEKNAKIHTEEQIEQIKKSIKEFGMNDPIGIWRDNIIIEGHGRLMACKELGMEEVPVIRLDNLTDDQRKAYTLIHNQTTMNTGFDLDILNEELENIELDMSLFGFDDFDFAIDLDDSEILEDEVPEVPEEPKAKLGDIYQLGNHRLICGDSTNVAVIDRLMDGVKADMVFTDPPYGMNLDTDWSDKKSKSKFYQEKGCKGHGHTYERIKGDNEDFSNELINTIFANFDYCKEVFIWGADYYPELLQGYKDGSMFVWDKRSNDDTNEDYVKQIDKMYGAQFELCWSKAKHRKEIARVRWAGMFGTETEFDKKRCHPTQKPAKLAEWFLKRFSKEGEIIADIFGGSGSTLIACEQLNRKCYMCELDEHYVDVIIQRWENFTGKKAIKLN